MSPAWLMPDGSVGAGWGLGWFRRVDPRPRTVSGRSISEVQVASAEDCRGFAAWLVAHGEADNLTARRLPILYAEWRELSGAPAISNQKLFRLCPGIGILRRREGSGGRRWFYVVRGCGRC